MNNNLPPADDIWSAGASAQAEYERRLGEHRARASQSGGGWLIAMGLGLAVALALLAPVAGVVVFMPIVGLAGPMLLAGLLMRTVFVPQGTSAWGVGAQGERLTAIALDQLRSEGFVVLHDRLIPGSAANIDHIVIGPPGVAVVETKSYRGTIRVYGGDVFIRGYRRTDKTVSAAKRQARVVNQALGRELERRHLAVKPILCVHRARLPEFGAAPQGVSIVDGFGLVALLRSSLPRLNPAEVGAFAQMLNDRLCPASISGPNVSGWPATIPGHPPVTPPSMPRPGGLPGYERHSPAAVGPQISESRTYWTPDGLAQGTAPTFGPSPVDDGRGERRRGRW